MVETLQNVPIHILYVDDDPIDRKLVFESLKNESSFRIVEAGTRDEFAAHLAKQHFDVVLSDFNILGYDGLQVIKTVKETIPKVPVIIVTGSGSEEIAVEAMKEGAADYVLKNPSHIRRLPLTIRTVLEQSRLRSELEMADMELSRFFEISRDLFCVLEPTGHIRRFNSAAREILGYEVDELKNFEPFQFVEPDDRPTAIQQLARLSGHVRVVRFSVRCLTKAGAKRWFEWSVNRCPERDHYFGVARDVTERHSTEIKQREVAIAQVRFFALSPREQDVLKLVVEGHPNKAVALKLSLSEKTVERHRSRGMKKLKLSNVPDMVRFLLLANV
jgi:two-component system response regulator